MDGVNESFSNMSIQDQTSTSAMEESFNVVYDGPIVKNVIDVIDLVSDSEPEETEEKPGKPQKPAVEFRVKTRSMARKEKELGLSQDEIFCLPLTEHRQKPRKSKQIPSSGSCSSVIPIQPCLSDEHPDASIPVFSSTPRRGAGVSSAAATSLLTRAAAAVTTTAAGGASSRTTVTTGSTTMSVTTLDSVTNSFTYPSPDSIICLDSTGFEDIAGAVSSAPSVVTTTNNLSVSSATVSTHARAQTYVSTSTACVPSSTGTRPVAVINPASTRTVTVPSTVTLPSTATRAVAANAANLIPAFLASFMSTRFPAASSMSSTQFRPVFTCGMSQSSSTAPYAAKPASTNQTRTHQSLWKSHGSLRDSRQQISLYKNTENAGSQGGGSRKDYWRNVDVPEKSRDAVDSRYKENQVANRYGAGSYYNRNMHRVMQNQSQNQGYRFDNCAPFVNQAINFATCQQPVFKARAKDPLDDLELENIVMMVFVDLDNISSFFKRLNFQLPPCVFVFGFHGGKYAWYEPTNCPIFQELKRRGMFKLHERCSFRKDAADFAICTAAGALNVKLPSKIPFIIVSGDKGFLEVERIGQSWSRHVLVLNPHRCANMSVTFHQIWNKYASNFIC